MKVKNAPSYWLPGTKRKRSADWVGSAERSILNTADAERRSTEGRFRGWVGLVSRGDQGWIGPEKEDYLIDRNTNWRFDSK